MSAIGRLRAWGLRLVASFGGGRRDRDLQEELETHLALLADEERRAGLPPGEAERTAAARFGSIAAVTDACRDRRGLPSLEHWLRDCRYAVRSLRRSPLLALSMIALLGLGIGAGTAILMVLHGIVWRSLPVPDADRAWPRAGRYRPRVRTSPTSHAGAGSGCAQPSGRALGTTITWIATSTGLSPNAEPATRLINLGRSTSEGGGWLLNRLRHP